MKRFDPQSIKQRGLKNLQTYDKWKNLQKDGAAEQFYEALAEPLAENARYGEYLLQEMKWDSCRNTSSAKHMANLVGKKLNRKHSAIGTIIVSHSDPEGNKRFSFLGQDNFDIDRESDYDSGKIDNGLTEDFYKKSLIPWTSQYLYSIPIGATFNTTSGVVFTAAEKRAIKTWHLNWEDIEASDERRATFIAQGGWAGYKYLLVPVVQGEVSEVTLGQSDGTAGQTYTVASLDIEAADSYYTRQFCYVEEIKDDGSVERWEEVYHLGNAKSTDKFFEIDILDDLSGTIIKFGDGQNGAIPSEKSTIILHFLKTSGAEGNIYDTFCFQNEINGAEIPEAIPFTDFALGCQSVWPIIGGKDFETFKEFKKNAENAYAKNYEILHTYTELEDMINTISPIPLVKIKTSEFYKEFLINSTKIIKPSIGISGLSTSMEILNSAESTIFDFVMNNNLNSKILSNKSVEYMEPNIIKIQSKIDLELKTPVVSNKEFSSSLEDSLQKALGKTNIDSIDQYMQSEILKRCLDYSEKIGSIGSNDLISISQSSIDLVTVDGINYSLCVNFQTPELNVDVYSAEEYCNKSAADGVKVPYIFNLNFGSNAFTLVVAEDNELEENRQIFCQSVLSDSLYKFYQNTNNLQYRVYELNKAQTTFSKLETQNVSNLILNSNPKLDGVTFFVNRNKNTISANLIIPVELVAGYLGFKSFSNTKKNCTKVFNQLESTLNSHLSSMDFYFTPTDKTIQSSWNTIFYYDNISVEVKE